jgi:hypothetical protein
MSEMVKVTSLQKTIHPWLRKIRCTAVPGASTPLLQNAMAALLAQFAELGHPVQEHPDDKTDVILTTARFGKPVKWRDALLFSARRRFKLSHTPAVYTLVHATRAEYERLLAHFEKLLANENADPAGYDFPGLASQAHQVLHAQGRRGGPILALERLVQAQAKSIRVILLVGESEPEIAYHFDLVGAYPTSKMENPEAFYQDIVLRIATTLSTSEVAQHQVVDGLISSARWKSLSTPAQMCEASQEFGQRNFFTDTVTISDLVHVPAVTDAISSQYGEGCFSTWEPTLQALIATVTGSARPVEKGNLTENDLAVLVGLREDGLGALVRHVAGKQNDPPSSEAVEMLAMDRALPKVTLGPQWDELTRLEVPVIRSKLHGHRSVGAYDPEWVEYVPLEPAYYHYLVSCATAAQAQGIAEAFSRSQALQNPKDPRQVVFSVLPGHGAMLVEKWIPGKRPFQILWEYMDQGCLQIVDQIPQGPMWYLPNAGGKMVIHTE